MSKRKLGTSYTSLRRQVKAQVDADLRFIAVEYNDDRSDESAHSSQVDSFCKPDDFYA